jgi:hypothetical protein
MRCRKLLLAVKMNQLLTKLEEIGFASCPMTFYSISWRESRR